MEPTLAVGRVGDDGQEPVEPVGGDHRYPDGRGRRPEVDAAVADQGLRLELGERAPAPWLDTGARSIDGSIDGVGVDDDQAQLGLEPEEVGQTPVQVGVGGRPPADHQHREVAGGPVAQRGRHVTPEPAGGRLRLERPVVDEVGERPDQAVADPAVRLAEPSRHHRQDQGGQPGPAGRPGRQPSPRRRREAGAEPIDRRVDRASVDPGIGDHHHPSHLVVEGPDQQLGPPAVGHRRPAGGSVEQRGGLDQDGGPRRHPLPIAAVRRRGETIEQGRQRSPGPLPASRSGQVVDVGQEQVGRRERPVGQRGHRRGIATAVGQRGPGHGPAGQAAQLVEVGAQLGRQRVGGHQLERRRWGQGAPLDQLDGPAGIGARRVGPGQRAADVGDVAAHQVAIELDQAPPPVDLAVDRPIEAEIGRGEAGQQRAEGAAPDAGRLHQLGAGERPVGGHQRGQDRPPPIRQRDRPSGSEPNLEPTEEADPDRLVTHRARPPVQSDNTSTTLVTPIRTTTTVKLFRTVATEAPPPRQMHRTSRRGNRKRSTAAVVVAGAAW